MAAYSQFSDAELTAFLKEGDQAAFAEIYDRFFGLLYIHAVRRLNNEEEARDLLQDIFANLWERRAVFQLNGQLSAYLYAAVRNRVINQVTRQKHADKFIASLASYADTGGPLADHRVREKDLGQLIEREISALPEKMRLIFIMSRTEHLSYKEIGEALEMSEQAVKSQMKRALKTLRVKLGLFTFLVCLVKFL